jgi:preprotein translocase subunit YajC
MSFLISDANAQAAAAGAGSMSDPLFTLLPLVLFAVVFYFLLIRPQSKRQKEHKRMVDGLTKGDEVLTLGGIAGRVTDLGDNFVLVEIAEGTQVKVRRAAVDAVLPKGSLKDLRAGRSPDFRSGPPVAAPRLPATLSAA